jgi:hypothetical protein
MGLLGTLLSAFPGVAAARTGYLQGQDEEADKQRALKRQSLIDQMKQSMDQSTIDENHARADYYRNGGAAGDDVQYVKGSDGQYYAMPKRMRGAGTGAGGSGSSSSETASPSGGSADPSSYGSDGDGYNATASSAPSKPATLGVPTGVKVPATAPKAPAAPRISKSGVVNPATGKIEDVFTDGSRKVVRDATADELAKAKHVPGSGTGAGGSGTMKPNIKETYLQGIADRAMQAAGGNIEQAEATVQNDPTGQQAYGLGLSTRHFEAAKAKYDRQKAIDSDVHPTMDPSTKNGPPPKGGAKPPATVAPAPVTPPAVAPTTPAGGLIDTLKAAVGGAPPPNYRGAPPPAKPTGNPISLGGENLPSTPSAQPPADAAVQRAQQAEATVQMAKSPRIQKAIDLLRSGHGSLDQLDKSNNFTDREKAYIRSAWTVTQRP